MTDFDAIVVGAGPAGGAAAIELARTGASVLLLDRAHFPRWKVCGACLSPGALEALRGLGLPSGAAGLGAVPLGRLVLASEARTVQLALDGSAALSRAALDQALVGAAESSGATFWPGARATLGGLEAGGRRVRVGREGSEVDLRARVVIDATGLGRGLPEDGRAVSASAPGARVGLGNEIEAPTYPVPPGEVRMAIGREGYVGLVRVESGALNVAAAVDPAGLARRTPHGVVSAILSDAGLPPLSDGARGGWKGTPSLTRFAREPGADRVLRLGDAAGYVEPFTGEGIGWALGDGRAAATIAARALDGWHQEHLEAWRQHRRARRRGAERLCRALAWALRRPSVVQAAVASLRVAPFLARPLIRRAGRAA